MRIDKETMPKDWDPKTTLDQVRNNIQRIRAKYTDSRSGNMQSPSGPDQRSLEHLKLIEKTLEGET